MNISNSNFSSFLLLLFLKSKNIIKSQSSFTLAEILITIAIVAVLSTAVIITLNPAEIIKSSRDSRRLEDLQKLNKAISWFETDIGGKEFMGTSSIVYVSIPDSTSTCANLGLPTLPSGWSYRCVSSSTLQNIDGTGWIPINFNKISFGRTLSKLPIDPVNNTSTGNYYTYVVEGSFKLTARLESEKYKTKGAEDGGYNPVLYETGSNLAVGVIKNKIYAAQGTDSHSLGYIDNHERAEQYRKLPYDLGDIFVDKIYWGSVIDNSSPSSAVRNSFHSRFLFVLNPDIEGLWEFAVDSDDGSELKIINSRGEEKILASWYGGHGWCNCQTYKGSLNLKVGERIYLDYIQEEWWGGEAAVIWIKKPGGNWIYIDTTTSTLNNLIEVVLPIIY